MNGNKRSLVIGALIGMVAGGSGIAVAGAVADSETITACVSTNGTLRIPQDSSPSGSSDQAARGSLPVSSSTTAPGGCLDGERTISWNQTGPVGPQGAQGETGPAGPQGEPGISGMALVARRVLIAAHNSGEVEIPCPDGKRPITAGYYARHNGPGLAAVDQVQVGRWGPDINARSWFYRGTNPLDIPVYVTVSVTCAILS
ncbi:hypothetical protein ACWEQG_22830 [Microbispora sp. NPDC004025]